MSCQELPRAARSFQELPGAATGAARSCQELQGAARSQELPGDRQSCQELPRATRGFQELPGAARVARGQEFAADVPRKWLRGGCAVSPRD